ncbi:MAG: shikimate dehydrogenase [Gemmatales bacterium]|nr:shikimate dehydrogenase [Gemmatales bacterium]MDW8176306.1 shikimate dehydrogenase [Gemmatales bacterium]
MLCVSIGRTRHKMMIAEIQEAARRGARFMELRLDFLAKAPDFQRLLGHKPCPLVATVRRQEDGGRWSRSEQERLTLLRLCIASGYFDWVDLETDIADKIPRFGKVKRIVSYHNPREFPKDLEALLQRMGQQDADVLKIAVRAEHPADNLRVLSLIAKSPKPLVAICLGDFGIASRILAGKFGAPFTYCAFNKERGIAPGILSMEEMQKIYAYDRIGKHTRVFAVVGDPIEHSLSPLVHNAAFQALGLDCVYIPLRVPKGELARTLQAFEQIPIEGYSVTLPHKEAAAQLAQEKDELTQLTGSTNTLLRLSDGRFRAVNTDAPAALQVLGEKLESLPGRPQLQNLHTLVLGAGGVARALVFALVRAGAQVTVANRTLARAETLARESGCRFVEWNGRYQTRFDVLINCTSVGMFPQVDETPMHHSALQPGQIVFDTVYNPETTLLIREARERGCQVITGVEMFVRQAALQFRLFTGKEPSLELIRKTVRRALSPVQLREEEELPDEDSE